MAARPKEEVLAPTESSPDGRYTRVRGTAYAFSSAASRSKFLCSAGYHARLHERARCNMFVWKRFMSSRLQARKAPSADDICGYNLAVCELSPWRYMRQRGAEDAAGVQQVSTAQNWQQSAALQQFWKDGHVCGPQGIGGMPDVCACTRDGVRPAAASAPKPHIRLYAYDIIRAAPGR